MIGSKHQPNQGEAVLDDLLAAKRPEDLFGDLPQNGAASARLRTRYVELAAQVHPDRNTDPRATQAFQNLQRLYEVAKKALRNGHYGKGNAVVDEITITTKRRTYKVHELGWQGDIANVYRATSDHKPVLVKIARSERDNDLIANEAKMLKAILGDKDFFDNAQPYLPCFIETFGYRPGKKGKGRQAITFFQPEYDLYSLSDVRRAYPDGVHPKDMAWMLRRLFMAMAFAHAKGIVHGAITPDHVLIQPELHGLVLIDWTAATEKEPIKIVSPKWKSIYPDWVFAKESATPSTDIFMAIECMKYVIGDQYVPDQMSAFFTGCQIKNLPPSWDLKDEFDQLLEQLWGRRRFRPFHMGSRI